MAHILDFPYLVYLPADNKRKGTSCSSGSSGTSYSVDIILNILRNVVIEYRLYVININSSCRNIRCNKNLDCAVSEAVHNLVTLELRHIAVESLCKITSSLKLLCQVINHLLGITKDKRTLRIIVI